MNINLDNKLPGFLPRYQVSELFNICHPLPLIPQALRPLLLLLPILQCLQYMLSFDLIAAPKIRDRPAYFDDAVE